MADEEGAVTRYVNRQGGETYAISGTLVGHGDSRSYDRDRWVEVDVFRTETGRYAVHRGGMSLVYHRAGNTTCTLASGRPKGLPAVKSDLPEGAVSCDVCEPPYPEELEEGEQVLYEWPRHSVKTFATPGEVVSDLYSVRTRSGGRGMTAGKPARDAIAQCMENDPAFRAEVTMEVQIR